MNTRLRLLIILLGALLVVGAYTFPHWQPYLAREAAPEGFPGLAEGLQEAYLRLPRSQQRLYLQMRQENAPMAVALLTARLSPDVPVPDELAAPPDVSAAVVVARSAFAPIDLSEVEMESEADVSPYQPLFGGQGSITIYQYPDNRKMVRFENFRVVNGPSLRVYLSTEPTPLIPTDLGRDFLDLGPLLGNVGSQNYAIPTEVSIRDYHSVVIFCTAYNFIFAVASF